MMTASPALPWGDVGKRTSVLSGLSVITAGAPTLSPPKPANLIFSGLPIELHILNLTQLFSP